jgi:hypothetical protein
MDAQQSVRWRHVQGEIDGGDWENIGQVMELYNGHHEQARPV